MFGFKLWHLSFAGNGSLRHMDPGMDCIPRHFARVVPPPPPHRTGGTFPEVGLHRTGHKRWMQGDQASHTAFQRHSLPPPLPLGSKAGLLLKDPGRGGGGGGQGIFRTAVPAVGGRPIRGSPVARPTGLLTTPVPCRGTHGRGIPLCPGGGGGSVWGPGQPQPTHPAPPLPSEKCSSGKLKGPEI